MSRRRSVVVALLACCVLAGVAYHFATPAPTAIDSDGDRRLDTWLHFDDEGRLVRLEKDKNRDGRPDWREHYTFDPALKRERLTRGQGDLDNDGFFETTVHHVQPGHAMRIERDRNCDGKADLLVWEDRDHPERRLIRRDDNYDGVFEQAGAGLSLF